jgi:glycosyltransferase involved in cell wall biosynthesis
VFVQQRLAALAQRADLQVAAPVPSFPVLSRMRPWPGPAKEQWQNLTVHRPRFFCVPGLLKNHDGRLYARGLRPWLAELVRTWRPDVLDAHFAWPDGVGVSLLARQFGLPCAITLRGKIYPCMDIPSQRRQCSQALAAAGAVICVSGPLAETARQLGADAERVFVIPNGVDTEQFRPRDKAEARRELHLPAEGRLLVTAAHLGPRKGHREVIQALRHLPADVRLVIVGGCAQGGGGRELLALADALGLGGRVILAGSQPYSKMPLYFNAADASVLASYREGCPNAVLESLACGTPVVATRVGAVPDLVTPGVNGEIVPPRQVQPLAEALAATLERLWSAETVSRSRAVRTWAAVAQEVHDVLERAAGEPTQPGR